MISQQKLVRKTRKARLRVRTRSSSLRCLPKGKKFKDFSFRAVINFLNAKSCLKVAGKGIAFTSFRDSGNVETKSEIRPKTALGGILRLADPFSENLKFLREIFEGLLLPSRAKVISDIARGQFARNFVSEITGSKSSRPGTWCSSLPCPPKGKMC